MSLSPTLNLSKFYLSEVQHNGLNETSLTSSRHDYSFLFDPYFLASSNQAPIYSTLSLLGSLWEVFIRVDILTREEGKKGVKKVGFWVDRVTNS